jgi:cytochrome c-type biogenesis protein CcmH
MLFWVFAALLTFAAALAVMRPFLRASGAAAAGVEHDLAVYRDQLAELELEVRRGLISEADAAEARAEIGRRILRLTQAKADESGEGGGRRLAAGIAVAAVLAVPVVSWGVYGMLGSPAMPALPLQARLEQDPGEASIGELIGRAEAYLAEHPEDVRGWQTLAPIYSRLGRYGDAAGAYRRIIALAGATADVEAALGEAMVGQSGGIITADAEAAFDRALALDGANPRARFFLGMARAQEGRQEEARALWREMAESLPEDSPWRGVARQALAGLDEEEDAASPGPLQEDMAGADDMTPQERQDMIEGMVASLDARLREEPADPEGWQRLLRSYVVLGRQADAADALERGLAALGPESVEAQTLAEFAGTLGITRNE